MEEKDFTAIVERMNNGDEAARNKALGLVLGELRRLASRRLARHRAGSIQASDLVNEAYVRLAGKDALDWQNRRHFFALAARAMHDILVERARAKDAQKRGGDWRKVTMDSAIAGAQQDPYGFLVLEAAIAKLLDEHNAAGNVIMLKFYAGLTVSETAEVLGVANRTVDRLLRFARAWLHRELADSERASGEQ
ncbi:MAG: ECF-type sigma factor [Pseudomonadota bacterium]